MKYFLMSILIPFFLCGCGVQIHILGGSGECMMQETEMETMPIPCRYIEMRCPICGRCIPEFIDFECLRMGEDWCEQSYRCSKTGEKFVIGMDEENICIDWIDYIIETPLPRLPREPSWSDTTRFKIESGDMPKPTRTPDDKPARIRSNIGYAETSNEK